MYLWNRKEREVWQSIDKRCCRQLLKYTKHQWHSLQSRPLVWSCDNEIYVISIGIFSEDKRPQCTLYKVLPFWAYTEGKFWNEIQSGVHNPRRSYITFSSPCENSFNSFALRMCLHWWVQLTQKTATMMHKIVVGVTIKGDIQNLTKTICMSLALLVLQCIGIKCWTITIFIAV